MEIDIIYNEDCYKGIKKIPNNSIDLVIIDPPYKYGIGGGGGAFGSKERNYHEEYLSLYKQTGSTKETERLRINANSQQQREQIRMISNGFDNKILDALVRVMKKINIYIWCSKGQLRQILDYFDNLKCNIDLLTWHKTNPIPTCNNTYLSDTEYLIFAREKGVKVYGNYHTKKKYWVTPANVEDKKKYKHPTIKPLDIIETLIINSSKENDVVLDCFMGSGTTPVACTHTHRHYIGFEIDEKYFDIACQRLDEAEGKSHE